MTDANKKDPQLNKVFFITSNQNKYDKFIEFQIPKNRGLINLKAGEGKSELKAEKEHRNSLFSVYVNSMEIYPDSLKEEDKNEEKKYKTILTMKYNKLYFPAEIIFSGKKNNYIFDLKFSEFRSWGKNYEPLPQITFSHLEQFKLYTQYLRSQKKLVKDKIYKDLLADSRNIAINKNKKTELDFFLEILKSSVTDVSVKIFIRNFRVDKISFPNDFSLGSYSTILNLIENNPKAIIRHCTKEEDKNPYYQAIYYLLFSIKYRYDTNNAIKMLNNKELWEHFINFLPENSEFFNALKIDDELLEKMFSRDFSKKAYSIITGILKFCRSIGKVLKVINAHIEKIAKSLSEEKEKPKIIMSSLKVNPKKTDDIVEIINEIKKIINYEGQSEIMFISFDNEFWLKYIEFNDDIKKLSWINQAIILCANVDKGLKIDNKILIEKIHKVGLESIKNGTLKNEQLLDFINIDLYFIQSKYANKNSRPLDVVNALDFDTMTDDFINSFRNSEFFKIFSFSEGEVERRIIDGVKDVKNFGKLLRLFNYKDKRIFERLTKNLRAKFENIAGTYKLETCPNFIGDVAYFIYIIDYQRTIDIKIFMKQTIEQNIHSFEIIQSIYINLASIYTDISKKAIDGVTDFLTNNKEKLDAKAILILLGKLKSDKIIESLLNKIESLGIKEEELFNEEKDIPSFQLLEGVIKDGLFNRLDFNKIKYLLNAIQSKENMMKKIKIGEISYDSVKKCFVRKEKKEIFMEKLKIFLFNNKEDFQECINILSKRFNEIIKIIGNINKLKNIFKEFLSEENKADIVKIENLLDQVKTGMMNEIEKPEFKSTYNEISNILSKEDFDKKLALKDSMFFVQLFRARKANNFTLKKESQIFKQTEEEFNKLKLFFESENWSKDIPETIIKDCFKGLKSDQKKKMRNELKNLINYFKIENFDDLKLNRLESGIITFNQKEEIFLTANSCIHLIDELEAEHTNFYTQLDNIRKGLQSNIALEKIEKFGKDLQSNGLNVLSPTPEDQNYLTILYCTCDKKNSIKFAASLENKDIRTLQELVNMSDDTFVTNNEIQDMIKCSKFLHDLGQIKGEKNDKQLIEAFINEVPKNKGIEAHFMNYANYAAQIQELFSKKLDKSQATLQQINNIMKSSTFILSINNTQDPYLTFEGEFSIEENAEVKSNLKYENIIELRERAMLTRKLGNDNEEEKKIFNLYRLFSERVSELEKINQLLKNLGEKGYSEDIKIVIDIKQNIPSFSVDNKNIENYEECSKYLTELYSRITENQTKYYKNEELIRYIYGRQFNLLNSCLKKERNNALAPFLKFLTNDKIDNNKKLNDLKYDYDYDLNEDKYICLFENIKKFLTDFLNSNNLKLENIYEQNIIEEKYRNSFKGLYIYLLESNEKGEVQRGIEEHILNWFNFLTGNPPMAQTVLLCNEETTSEELTAFMYRAFLCQYPVFFMIGKIELLTSDKRQTLTNLINILFSKRANEMKSCVAFGCTVRDDSLVRTLENLKGRQYLKHDDKKKIGKKLYKENVEIISSDKAGVGKSTQIKLKIKSQNKKYIHFPFGGEFSRKDVINRLKKVQDKITNEDNTVIHLDLYDSKQTDLMKDFLYSFLVTKLYGQSENLFYLSKKVKIVIEIPCGFVDFFNKYPLLSMFENRTEMKIANLPPLIVPKVINSNVQIVCNYLKLLNSGKLSETDLIINGVSLLKDDIKKMINEDVFNGDTTKDAELLDQKECDALIKDLLKNKLKIKYPTYYQINSFINVFSGQLKNFSMNFELTAACLIERGKYLRDENFHKMREIMVKSFIQNTIHFTQGAFDKILTAQLETYKVKVEQGNYDEDKQEEVAVKALSEPGDIISCNKIDPPLVFFHEGEGQNFSIITNDNPNTEEYNKLLQLRIGFVKYQNFAYQVNKINKREEEPKKLKHYTEFDRQELFWEEIKQILSIKNPVYNRDKKQEGEGKKLKSIEEIVGEYVFTADNFIKMILILLRIRENIPVIMMGETGCGKTSLIRKLSELINNGEKQMEILNIHAGITDEEIVNFLFEKKEKDGVKYPSIIEKAKQLKEREEKIEKAYNEEKQKYFKKKLWVFLDEINTCNCMGLICELMTKHTCQGVELPDNIFFIGACNPYRYGQKGVDNYALKLKDVKEKNLVYTVNPLPFSLLNFVFNFGNLTSEDEKRYIRNMVVSPITKIFWNEILEKNKNEKNLDPKDIDKYISKEDDSLKNELIKLSSDAIIEAQEYVRKKNDVSSVSLREIRRFSIFYEFFVEYFKKNKKIFENLDQRESYIKIDDFYKNLTKSEIYRYSIKLSIYLCYYMRLTCQDFRDDLAKKMSKLFGDKFIEIPEHEQQFIASNIELGVGIAKNRALLENLFTLFACVNAKIPLFIVGKPGCSKSLSVQLLFKAMQGDSSDNFLFKSLPKLFINAFQGSLGSTSKGVLNIFKTARNILKNNIKNLDKIISMIYFDEMGLAEHSPNNPLKVIHSELEYDLNEGNKKIAFVGISNWVLDASKMNRGLFLSIPPPNQKDLEVTAYTIAESYNEKLAKDNADLFKALANTYHDYKEKLKTEYTFKEDFHGSRDFYHLIKTAMRILLKKKKEDYDLIVDENVKQEIGIISIERNFAGLEIKTSAQKSISSLEIIKNIFKKYFKNCDTSKNYKVLQTICDNIKDKDSRYLLLVTKSSISNYLLNSILTSPEFKKDIDKELSFYIGSGFHVDIHSEGYGLKILNKIQLQMEQNKILLLSDLDAMYPSLYDLFNQNFTVVGKKNYARIAMGSTNNTFSLVNDGFKCIVLVDEKGLEEEKAPFLNRFEKHIISFEYLLDDKFIKEADRIYEMVQSFGKIFIKQRNIDLKYNIKYLLINCDKEEIRGITYKIYSEYKKSGQNLMTQDLQDFILEKISLTLSQDIILLIKNSGFEEENPGIPDKIIEFYKRGEHTNLLNFLKKMKNPKNVIYTFTSIDNALLENVSGKFDTELLGTIDKSNIKEIKISSLNEEKDLEAILEDVYLYQKDKIKIVLFKFTPYQAGIMNYIKFFIENHIKEKNYLDENYKKVFIFSVHMNRIFKEDENNVKRKRYVEENILTDTITHLSDFYQIFIDDLNGEDFSIVDIMKLNQKDLFAKCLKVDTEFTNNIYNTFSYFNYNLTINIEGIDTNNYPKKIYDFLKKNQELSKMFIDCILKNSTEEINIGDILKKNELFDRDNMRSIIEIVQKYLSTLFNKDLSNLIFKLETDNFLSVFIFNEVVSKKIKANPNIILKVKDEENNEIKKDENEFHLEKVENNGENENIEKNYYLNNNLIKLLIETYVENVDYSQVKVGKNMKNNKLQLLMGLKTPGIYSLLDSFSKYIKSNLKNKYSNAEKDVLFLIQDDQNFDRELSKYNNKIKDCQRIAEIELLKNKFFEKINELENRDQRETHEFFELLMNDYYLIFLSKNLPNLNEFYQNIDYYKNLINLMLGQRFNTEQDEEEKELNPIKDTAKKILWIETYSQNISILLNIYKKLSEFEEDGNLFNKIEQLIEDKEIILEEDDKRNPYYTKYIKSPFYYISESLLRLSINKINTNELKEEKFYDFINLIKTISKDILTIYDDLLIYSKENHTINEFLEIENRLHNVNKNSSENILKALEILLNVTKTNIEEEKGKDLSNYIEQLFDFLLSNLGDTEEFRELIMEIFVSEIKKVRGDDYRKTLVNKILNNKNLIAFSYQFMSILMNELISEFPNEIKDNIAKIQENKSPWLELINKADNKTLNEILLNIFEKKINIYFEEIPKLDEEALPVLFKNYYDYMKKFDDNVNQTLVLSNTSLEVFQDCIFVLETIYNERKEKKEDNKNDLICELYAIAYIKIYMFKYITFTYKHYQLLTNYEEILKAIEGNGRTNVRKMIKIYAFKVFYYLINNYQDFKDYNYKNHQINFFDELKDTFIENKVAMLSYYMLPNDKEKMEVFKEYFDKFDAYKFDNFSKPINQFVDYIKNNGIDNFYMISTDLIVSNLSSHNYTKDFNEYTKYSSFTKNLFNDPNINIPKITKDLFFLYSNDEVFNKMKKKLSNENDNIDANRFEILLYGLRFCLQTSNIQNPDGFLYSEIITEDCEKKISKNCIPGNNTSGNYYVQNYNLLENHLNTKPSDNGAYVCGCGYFYSLEPCGFPARGDKSGICPKCNHRIGSGDHPPGIKGFHGFAHEKGHYRIFKNIEQKKKEFARFTVARGYNPPDTDESIPNMLLADYKKIIDDKKEKEKLGISKVQRNFFEDTKEKVRNQSQIGYRLLNFILYSHLFYSNCLGFIKDEDMKKYVCDEMTCIEMLETDWNILKVELQSKGIQIIQIFLNLIFDKLSEKIKNCKEIITNEDRDKFENEIEKFLEESYKEYENYAKLYNENNEKMLELNKHNMKSLVTETNDVDSYEEKDYPFYRYFLMTTYPTIDNFKYELQKVPYYQTKYPLLTNYILKPMETKDLIKYLPEFNEFCNFMIDYYSYKISRDDASKRKIKDEDLYKNDEQNFRKKFDKFIAIWSKLSTYATKYGCRDKMDPIDLSKEENQYLAYFLNDNGDIGKGMYIAAAYQNFIDWQNYFLDLLIEPSRQSGILHHYVKNMEKTIYVQNAKKNETLDFSSIDLNLAIYENSRRNIFKKDNTINYMNYKQYIYDFDEIEKQLGEKLLPGKVKFEGQDKLKFVTFCFEGFRGNKSSVFIEFSEKYKENPLSPEKKQKIYDIISGKINKQKEDELSIILFSIQLLMYYLTQEIHTEKEEIKVIINDLPEYVKLSKECKEFFESDDLSIKVEDLIGLYNFFESLCFTPIINNLQEHYKKNIDEEVKKEIKKLFDEKKFKLINKKTLLATACRKFISRYLVSTRNDTDINENDDLSVHLTRQEIWPKEIFDIKGNDEILDNDLDNFKNLEVIKNGNKIKEKLIVGQCYELYQLLGGDDKEELKGINVKKINLKENIDNGDEDEDHRKFRIRRRYN